MELTWDEAKRQKSLSEHGLDFALCDQVFAGATYTFPDDRKDYGEERFICFGSLNGRLVAVVYTIRDGSRRIISMRKANEREQAKFAQALG